MNPMTLVHLTFLGSGKEPASIEFGPHSTVVHGASDTGKSFLVEAIDYMLGGASLKQIPEAQGYTHILFGIRFGDSRTITLVRGIGSNKFDLHEGDLRSLPASPALVRLGQRHSPISDKNISRYLLKQIGLDEFKVRKNAHNVTQDLSFRNLAHLCMVSETQMQDKKSPVLTGQYVSKTAEISAFRCLVNGTDDSGLTPIQSGAEKKVSKGKRDLLESLISSLKAQLTAGSNLSNLNQQHERVIRAIADETASAEEIIEDRSEVIHSINNLATQQTDLGVRIAEIRDLLGRFGLLEKQYKSDLARLEMVGEAGSLLGFFQVGTCIFCGADPQHQLPGHLESENDSLTQSIEAESSKTIQLLADLRLTLSDLHAQREEIHELQAHTEELISAARVRASALERELAPLRSGIADAIQIKSEIEKQVSLHEQIDHLKSILNEIPVETRKEAESPVFDVDALEEFTEILQEVLDAWEVPNSSSVRFDEESADIAIGQRLRSVRGKGVRAILHAAFTVALAEYCERRSIPHPGFVVLDSPVVTYRGPDEPEDELEEATMNDGVAHRLYKYLDSEFVPQAIIVENVDPPSGAIGNTVVYKFTGVPGFGRYGFFPESI